MSIKVKAVFDNPNGFGFYDNQRRYDGDVFDVASKEELGSWMEVLEERKKPGPKPKAEPKEE